MNTNAPSDAGVVNIKGTDKALAFTVDCNPRYVHANPEEGTAIAVAEAARNIVCSGGEPSAISNCLNFGNPYNPEVFWQFEGAIKGMSKACIKFETPVTGGNVSFYNQTQIGNTIEPVFPTPTIGMMGILEDKNNKMSLNFKNKGDMIYLIGKSKNDIASSQYLVSWHKIDKSPSPIFDIDEEYNVQNAVKSVIKAGLINSAHDVSDGGLFTTLLESAIAGKCGFDITSDAEVRKDAFLFGESQSRVVVSVETAKEDKFIDLMQELGVDFSVLGHVTAEEVRIDDHSYGFINDFRKDYDTVIEKELTK
jgi:phosphoribosylformylglycinamidine synthase